MALRELDRLDRRLLNELQRDAGRTNEELGRAIGLSPASVLRRVRRLRETGVLEGVVALVAPAAVERNLIAISEITLKRQGADERNRFLGALSDEPSVTQCYLVTGDVDVVIVASFLDMAAFDQFVEQRLASDRLVERIRTHFVMRRVKFSPRVVFDDGVVGR